MKKRYFWAADFHTPNTLHRFSTKRDRDAFINGIPAFGEVNEFPSRQKVDKDHRLWGIVRRIQRRIVQGEQVTFPVEID